MAAGKPFISLRTLPKFNPLFDDPASTSRPLAPLQPNGKLLSKSPKKLVRESKTVTRSMVYKTPFLTEKLYEITLIFSSNHGDPNYIRCSSLQFFQKNDIPMKVHAISVDDVWYQSFNVSLFNNQIIKDRPEDEWISQWTGRPIRLRVCLAGTDERSLWRVTRKIIS